MGTRNAVTTCGSNLFRVRNRFALLGGEHNSNRGTDAKVRELFAREIHPTLRDPKRKMLRGLSFLYTWIVIAGVSAGKRGVAWRHPYVCSCVLANHNALFANPPGDIVAMQDTKSEEQATSNGAGADAEHRELGDVTVKIDGRWLEFETFPEFAAAAIGCTTECSNFANSEPLGNNNSPWTYTTRSCTRLEVVEGAYSGNNYLDVYDNGRFLFTTTPGDENEVTFTEDPDFAWRNAKFGKGSVKLQPGFHSIVIRTRWMNPAFGEDHGWFRIRTVDCVDRPTCLTTGSSCATGTCCPGLICRRRVGDLPSSPNRCLACSQRNQRCVRNADCCNGMKCLLNAARVKRCFVRP
jgi:Dickkopf N-terminal cysteine-rich region